VVMTKQAEDAAKSPEVAATPAAATLPAPPPSIRRADNATVPTADAAAPSTDTPVPAAPAGEGKDETAPPMPATAVAPAAAPLATTTPSAVH
jgi:hypothetical protein